MREQFRILSLEPVLSGAEGFRIRQLEVRSLRLEVRGGSPKSEVRSRISYFILHVSCYLLLTLNSANADILMELESGNNTNLQNLITESQKKSDTSDANFYLALNELYSGDLEKANHLLVSISSNAHPASAWLKNYLTNLVPIYSQMEIVESKHFILRVGKREKILSDFALEALERAYDIIGEHLNHFPKEKIRVEIYPTEEIFSLASTLTSADLDRSGAIGICKFRRLMILSPEQLAFGYRWLDTLTHEYVHYLINILSGGKCPLWLHEGIAKYLDTRWRLEIPQYLSPGNRTELVKAAKEDRLIPFIRMAPSMIYLKDQSEVRLAFSQVAHAVDYVQGKRNSPLRNLLVHFSTMNQQDVFYTSIGVSFEQFEKNWKKYLVEETLEESPGAMVDNLKIGTRLDEVEELVSINVRGHIRLGDRLRRQEQMQAALLQYEKALKQEPANPVALTKSARVLIALGRNEEAIQKLEKCIQENPNYSSAILLLAGKVMEKSRWQRALELVLEANAINPFNPQVHHMLSEIYNKLGKSESAKKSEEIYRYLTEQKQR